MGLPAGRLAGDGGVISLCSGVGGLDLGLRLALPQARTSVYVEVDAHACAVVVARIKDGTLDRAPVWGDLRTFSGRPWRGRCAGLIGGYPCQPFSVAGTGRTAYGTRLLWPHVARIVGEAAPLWCFFENVRQHANVGLRAVLTDLCRLGYRVAGPDGTPCYGFFSAAEVGASQRRDRLFILAYTDGGRRQSGAARPDRDAPAAPPVGTRLPLFPPAPDDDAGWRAALAARPDLAPATEPALRGMAAESAGRLDRRRDPAAPERLRRLGNSVVPLTAAFAFVTLARIAGLAGAGGRDADF